MFNVPIRPVDVGSSGPWLWCLLHDAKYSVITGGFPKGVPAIFTRYITLTPVILARVVANNAAVAAADAAVIAAVIVVAMIAATMPMTLQS